MTGSHDDPWAGARDAQREEVQAIWADRGGPPPQPPRPKWPWFAAAAAAAVVVALTALLLVPSLKEDADRLRAQERRALEREKRAERERLLREGRPVRAAGPVRRRGEGPIGYRARLVAAGEREITANARERLAAGEIKGTIAGTYCRPFPFTDTREDQEIDPAIPRNRYQCTAYSRRFALPEVEGRRRYGVIGTPFWLIADYGSGQLTFCRVTPRPGEGGQAFVVVPVAPACRNPLA